MKELINTSLVISTIIIVIFEGFFLFVYNPAAVAIGDEIIRDGHLVQATQWDAFYSYTFPIYWTLGTALAVIVVVCIIDVIWNLLVNSLPG